MGYNNILYIYDMYIYRIYEKLLSYQLQIVRIFDFTNSNNSSNFNHCNHNIPHGDGHNGVRIDRIIATIMQL